MNGGSRVPTPYLILWGSGVALSCGLDGQVLAEELHGLFAGDTRVLSTYQVLVSGQAWRLLGRSHFGHGTAQWEYQNRPLRDVTGEIAAGTLLLTLRRRVDCALHDDLHLQAFADRTITIQLTLQLDADFADIFEVKNQSLPPRVNTQRVTQQKSVALSSWEGTSDQAGHEKGGDDNKPERYLQAQYSFPSDGQRSYLFHLHNTADGQNELSRSLRACYAIMSSVI